MGLRNQAVMQQPEIKADAAEGIFLAALEAHELRAGECVAIA
jgi:hypothetical protein